MLDGHGGRFARAGLRKNFHRSTSTCGECDAASTVMKRGKSRNVIEAVRQMEVDLRRCGRPTWACGTTLVTLLVTDRSLTVANVGDSRAVLCRAGLPVPLSRDHKPKLSAERQRILHAGGFIVDGRVNGDLSLSRALGDFRHKVNNTLCVGPCCCKRFALHINAASP